MKTQQGGRCWGTVCLIVGLLRRDELTIVERNLIKQISLLTPKKGREQPLTL